MSDIKTLKRRMWSTFDLKGSLNVVEAGEGFDEDGHRIEEVENEFLEDYENCKDNCLEKFSEFLGFPTRGFENEILNLMRKLVAMQQLV